MKLEDPEDVVWCGECGQGMPWRHKPQPTRRRRLIEPLRRAIRVLVGPLVKLDARVVQWADRPHEAIYAVQYAELLRQAVLAVGAGAVYSEIGELLSELETARAGRSAGHVACENAPKGPGQGPGGGP